MATPNASDWINIAGIVGQIIVAIGIAVWQSRASKIPVAKQPAESQPQALTISNAKWFFNKAWGFLFGIPLSIFWLWVNISSSEPPTRGFIALLFLLSAWLLFNLLGTLVCLAVAIARKT